MLPIMLMGRREMPFIKTFTLILCSIPKHIYIFLLNSSVSLKKLSMQEKKETLTKRNTKAG